LVSRPWEVTTTESRDLPNNETLTPEADSANRRDIDSAKSTYVRLGQGASPIVLAADGTQVEHLLMPIWRNNRCSAQERKALHPWGLSLVS